MSSCEKSGHCGKLHSNLPCLDHFPYLDTVEEVARIAIVAFAVYMRPALTLACSVGGIALGLINGFYQASKGRDLSRMPRAVTLCSQNQMEFLSGQRFPAVVTMVSTAAYLFWHVKHGADFFAPLAGFFGGMWAGQLVVSVVRQIRTGAGFINVP